MNTLNNYLSTNLLNIRRAIGLLGISLAPVLVVGNILISPCNQVLDAISSYYFSYMGDVFVGILCTIAVFFFNYKGYDTDYNLGKVLGVLAFCIAFFPAYQSEQTLPCIAIGIKNSPLLGKLHTGSAALFFCLLAYYCLVLFPKGNSANNPEKQKRNKIYKTCGYTIVLMLVLILSVFLLPNWKDFLNPIRPVLSFESIALVAFGISWLTKGQMLFADFVPEG
jgi:hypothetical protein